MKQIAERFADHGALVYLPAIAGTPLKQADSTPEQVKALGLSPGNRRDSVEARQIAADTRRSMVYLPAIAGTPLKL